MVSEIFLLRYIFREERLLFIIQLNESLYEKFYEL